MLKLGQANTLKPTVDTKSEDTTMFVFFTPSPHELLCRFSRLRGEANKRARDELVQAILDFLRLRVSGANGDETFDQGFEVARYRAPDISGLPFNFVNRIVCTQSALDVFHSVDVDGIEETMAAEVAMAASQIVQGMLRLSGDE